MKRAIILAIVVLFGLSAAFLGYASAQEGRVETGAISPALVKGEVSKIDGEVYSVKDRTGKEVKFSLEKDMKAKLERPLKVGDQIEAQLTPEGFAKSINVVSTDRKSKSEPKDIGTIQAPGTIEGGIKDKTTPGR
jgi:predicted AAA+ superfamily ATPase